MNLSPEDIQALQARQSFTRRELAKRFGVSRNTITNWIHAGRFRGESGQPVAWQDDSWRREWRVLAEAVYRLEAALEITDGQGVVNVHDVDGISVLVVEYDQS